MWHIALWYCHVSATVLRGNSEMTIAYHMRIKPKNQGFVKWKSLVLCATRIGTFNVVRAQCSLVRISIIYHRLTALNKHSWAESISKEFKEWIAIAIAKDRPKWRQQTHSNQNLLMLDGWWTIWEYMVIFALCKKNTQPSQTCTEGYTFLVHLARSAGF